MVFKVVLIEATDCIFFQKTLFSGTEDQCKSFLSSLKDTANVFIVDKLGQFVG